MSLRQCIINTAVLSTLIKFYHKNKIMPHQREKRFAYKPLAIHHMMSHIGHSNQNDNRSIFELEDMYLFYTESLKIFDETNSVSVMNKTRFK